MDSEWEQPKCDLCCRPIYSRLDATSMGERWEQPIFRHTLCRPGRNYRAIRLSDGDLARVVAEIRRGKEVKSNGH